MNEDDITVCIHSIPKRAERVMGTGNRKWTAAVKSAFIELGKKHDWLVCASSSEAGVEPEWLWDLTWYKRDEKEGLEIGLVLESEWYPDYFDLRFDFEKLLVAKSPYKVFAFEAYGENILRLTEKLCEAVDNCHHRSSDETYFIICYNPPARHFEIRIKKGT